MAADVNKINEVSRIIERIAELMNGGDNSAEINVLKLRLEEITGKNNIDVDNFRDFWAFTSVESLAERLLMPNAKKMNLSDDRITEIIRKICLCDYSEAETDYWIEVLEKETGICVSDYIYFPYTKGLEITATEEEIARTVLLDRKLY
ncbi:MAG: hypothetical protein IJ666_03250 [Ruminococcus sp.]|nr:hypothetical protein [Ruminococcus sp.]